MTQRVSSSRRRLETGGDSCVAIVLGVRVENPGGLPGAIAQVLDHGEPAVLDVVTATRRHPPEPPTIELAQVKILAYGCCGQ